MIKSISEFVIVLTFCIHAKYTNAVANTTVYTICDVFILSILIIIGIECLAFSVNAFIEKARYSRERKKIQFSTK